MTLILAAPKPVEAPPVIEVRAGIRGAARDRGAPAAEPQVAVAAPTATAIPAASEQNAVPVMAPEPEPLPALETLEDDEADPSEVRRNIATAWRNMDPDHQIRRAMDAFLSPSRPNDNGSHRVGPRGRPQRSRTVV